MYNLWALYYTAIKRYRTVLRVTPWGQGEIKATHPATMIVTCSPSRLRLARGPMYDSMQRNL